MASMVGEGIKSLPREPRSSVTEFVDQRSIWHLVAIGVAAYLCVVLSATGLELALSLAGFPCVWQTVAQRPVAVTTLSDLVYFNFVTIMTIGYGDLTPTGGARLIVALEAIVGVAVFGAIVGASVLKMTLPRRSSVVFSRFCYYVEDEARFVVVFVNATKSRLVNVDLCSVLKIGQKDWVVRPSFRAPYVGSSAWTFSVDCLKAYLTEEELTAGDFRTLSLYPDDGLKFGVSGFLGLAVFSASVRYSFDKCYVLGRKADLPQDDLRDPAWGSPAFESAFHFTPPDPVTFLDYVRQRGAAIK